MFTNILLPTCVSLPNIIIIISLVYWIMFSTYTRFYFDKYELVDCPESVSLFTSYSYSTCKYTHDHKLVILYSFLNTRHNNVFTIY